MRVLLAAALLACPAAARAASFFELCDKAQAAADPAAQVELYTQALGVWAPADTEANRALVLNNRGIGRQALGRHDEALADYNAALILAPRVAATHENRGTVLESLGRADDALQAYERALKLDPSRTKASLNGARIHIARKQPAKALKSLTRVLSAAPGNVQALAERAALYAELERDDEALEDYKAAMAAAPEEPSLRVNRGLLYWDIRRTAEAGADFVAAAALYRRLKMPEKEMAELERAIEASPRTSRPRAARGAAFLARGLMEEAEADALTAATLGTKEAGGEVLLGRLSFARGKFEAAERFFESALVLKAGDGDALLGLAFAAQKLGRTADALARFKAARASGEPGYTLTAKEYEAFKSLSAR